MSLNVICNFKSAYLQRNRHEIQVTNGIRSTFTYVRFIKFGADDSVCFETIPNVLEAITILISS